METHTATLRLGRTTKLPTRRTTPLSLLASVSVVAGCLGGAPIPEQVVVIDLDFSDGMTGDQCRELAQVVDALREDETLWRGVEVVALGTSDLEPVELYRGRVASIEDYGRTADAVAAEAHGLREGVGERCRALTESKRFRRSPIYRSLYRAAATLTALCAARPPRALCQPVLLVHSDLRETVEAGVIEALKEPDPTKRRAMAAKLSLRDRFPPSTTVRVCGLAASKDAATVRPEILEDVWREILPPTVVFEPTCATTNLGGPS